MKYRITFSNEPEKNGESTTTAETAVGCLRAVHDFLDAAHKRRTPTIITIVVEPQQGEGHVAG